MADLTIPQKDKGYNLNFAVQTSTGGAYDLTAYTIKLRVWKAGIPTTLVVDAACSTVGDTSTGGFCHYVLTGTDFANIAGYKMELELIKSGVIESTENYDLKVEESGGGTT